MANLVFLLVFLGLLGAAYLRPGIAAGVTLSGFAIEQCAQAFVPVAGANNALTNYVLALIVIVAVTRQVARFGLGPLLPRGPTWPPLLLLGYCYLTLTWSIFPSTTERALILSLPYLVTFVGLTPLTVRSPEDLGDALLALVVATTVTLIPLLLFGEWRGRSVYLPFGDFNSNPLALTQTAGACLVCVILSPVLWRLPKVLALPGAGVALATVFFTFLRTGSRGQIVSSIGTVLLFVATTRRGVWFVPAMLGGLGLLASGLLEEEVRPNETRWSERQIQRDLAEDRLGASERLLDYWSSSDLFHQIFGLGTSTAGDPRILGSYPHVVPVEVLCEEGIVGAALFATAILVTFYYSLQAIRAARGHTRHLFSTALALTLYEFLLTLKQGSLTGATTFFTLLALPTGFRVFSQGGSKQEASSPDVAPNEMTQAGAFASRPSPRHPARMARRNVSQE